MPDRSAALTPRMLACVAGLGVACATPIASATWSILIADTRTGEIALGSATCVPGINLRSNTPVLILGRGAVTAQSVVDSSGLNRARIFDGFARGMVPAEILADLAVADAGHGNRQYGFIDASGNALTYSGVQNAAWAGGVTGRIDLDPPGPENDLVYSVQGNILTGAPVVLAAEDAILNTPGDLAEKLMAGMEAAYALGGDGRCSGCLPTDDEPDLCAPPLDFIKTADVGYMLVGRLGDREQGGSFVPVAAQVGVSLVGDLNGDDRADIVEFPSFAGPVTFRENVTQGPGGPFVFDGTALTGSAFGLQYAALADVDADGNDDIVYVTVADIRLIRSNGAGSFETELIAPVAGGVDAAVLGEFNTGTAGPELVVLSDDGFQVYAFGPAGAVSLVASQAGVISGGSNAIAATADGVVVFDASGPGLVPFATNGDGTFSRGATIATPGLASSPGTLLAGDLNGDGRTDYAYTQSLTSVGVLVDDGVGGFVPSTVVVADPGPEQLRDVKLVDIDGDGDEDISMLLRGGRFASAIDQPGGGFGITPVARLLRGTLFSAGDFDNDGLPEIVAAENGILGVYRNAGEGPPIDDRGFAGGDYFLELNVAGGPDVGFDDPVLQLRSEFDAWRVDRAGLADGSRSTLGPTPGRVFSRGSSSVVTFRATINDFAGDRVSGLSVADFAIEAPAGMPVLLEIASVVEVAGDAGMYEITAGPTGATGESRLWLRVRGLTPGGDAVSAVVQPAPMYVGAVSLADFNSDGVLDLSDIVAFLSAFVEADPLADPSADIDGNGVFELADLNLFVAEFLGS